MKYGTVLLSACLLHCTGNHADFVSASSDGLQETSLLSEEIEKNTSPTLDTPDNQDNHYTTVDYSNQKLLQKILQGLFAPDFLTDFEKMVQRLDMHAMALLSVMDYETGGSFSSYSSNKWGATGLIQFTPQRAVDLATTIQELANMSQIQQLTYVEKHFRMVPGSPDFSQPENVAIGVFRPGLVGRPTAEVLFTKTSNPQAYKRNKTLDVDKSGGISIDEYINNALNRGYMKE